MPLFACSSCGKTSDQRQCPAHRRPKNAPWSPNRNPASHARFAKAVKQRDGHQCTAVIDGVRCPVTTGLRAHHLTSLRDGGSDHPSNGVTLCAVHDREADKWAR